MEFKHPVTARFKHILPNLLLSNYEYQYVTCLINLRHIKYFVILKHFSCSNKQWSIASNNGLLNQFYINNRLKCLKCFVFSNMIKINLNDNLYLNSFTLKQNIIYVFQDFSSILNSKLLFCHFNLKFGTILESVCKTLEHNKQTVLKIHQIYHSLFANLFKWQYNRIYFITECPYSLSVDLKKNSDYHNTLSKLCLSTQMFNLFE